MTKLINKNERIFIAGGYGMVGSAIYNKLLESGYGKNCNGGEILRPSREELDLTNFNKEVEKWFRN